MSDFGTQKLLISPALLVGCRTLHTRAEKKKLQNLRKAMDMDSMATSIGLSVPVLRFLICFAATIPVSFFWRFIPGSTAKHVYSAGSGVLLSYLSFGFSSNLHFLVPMLLGYASMVFYRSRCGILTFFIGFGYLIGWYV